MSTGGIPTTDNIPETTENSGVQPTIYPTTDFLKHLILSYSFGINHINELTNIYLKFYFKIMFLSHNIVLAMRWLFTTYNVMSRNVTAKKWLVTTCNGQKCFVTVTKCDITLLSVINRYKSLYVILDKF
jgi:hypothetical protein